MNHQEKAKYIFDVLERSQVSITVFSALSKTSRASLHLWKKGGNITDELRLGLAVNVARRLDKAVQAGRLPLNPENHMKAKERLEMIRRIAGEMG